MEWMKTLIKITKNQIHEAKLRIKKEEKLIKQMEENLKIYEASLTKKKN